MEEAIKYIYEDSDDLIVKARNNELWFNMGNYEVIIRLLSLSCFNINENDMEYLINELAFENLLNNDWNKKYSQLFPMRIVA